MKTTYNNRPVEITSVTGKYEDDLQIEAYYSDTDEEIDDGDILYEILKENYGECYQSWYEDKVCEAEYLCDRD